VAGYKETFGANVDYAYGRGVTDLTSRLNQGISGAGNLGSGIAGYAKQMANAKRGVNDLASEMKMLKREMDAAVDPQKFLQLARQMDNAKRAASKMRKEMVGVPFDAMEKGLKKVVTGLTSLNTGILSISFNFLIDSIKRVYDLQEKWTHAIGGFNMKIGGMTKGLGGAQKAATQWSSTIRSLTNGSIEEGIQMFGEFTMAMGRTVKAGDKFSKFGVQLARGFGIGGGAAGGIAKVFENIGMSADDANEAMKTSIKAANEAGIPVNMLAEDISKSITYMARFGKEGQKTLIQGAAWARKYDIALEQLKTSVEGFDAFDDAAKSASKLNTAFGTMINSMDLMMEDDPAKRLDMIRQEMLAQGQTYDKLTPKQRRYFSETMKLSDEQTAALLDAKNANESYTDFAAKAAAKEKGELSAKALMQKQLQATTQTMYAFGMAFDRITLAIANAIQPLLHVFGLATDGNKKFKNFGGVMESVTKTVEDFFNSLAKNKKWGKFMEEIGHDLQRAGTALKDFVMNGGAAKLVGDISDGMKSFYETVRDLAIHAAPMFRPLMDVLIFLTKHIKAIAIAWGGMKAINIGRGIAGNVGGLVGGGGGGGGGGMLGGMGGRLGMAGAAGALGYAVGGKGAGIGAGVGNLIGGLFGPIGMVAGTVIGGLIGKGIEKILHLHDYTTDTEKAQKDLEKSIKSEQETRERYEQQVSSFTARQEADDTMRKSMESSLLQIDKQAKAAKTKEVTLTKEQAESLRGHAAEFTLFAKSTKLSREMLEGLGEGSKLTSKQLDMMMKGSKDYNIALESLRDTSEKFAQQQVAQLQVSQVGAQKGAISALVEKNKSDILGSQSYLQGAGVKGFDPGKISEKQEEYFKELDDAVAYTKDPSKFANTPYAASLRGFLKDFNKLPEAERKKLQAEADIRKKTLDNIENERKLQMLQTQYTKEASIIQLRSLEMGSQRFLEYQKTSGIKDIAQAFDSYLADNKDSLSGLYGESGYELLSERPDFNVPKLARGGVVTRPTKAIIGEAGPEAVVPLKNYAGGGSGDSGVTTPVEIHLDGQKLGRALVRHMIRGRN
jgi:hypothetical protein